MIDPSTTSPSWVVQLDGRSETVRLGQWSADWGFPRTFSTGGVEHRLDDANGRPWNAPFDLAGHAASITLWHAMPALGTRLGRALLEPLQGRRRRAFEGKPSASYGWSIYELRVDGKPRGSWVLTSDRGVLRSWSFVEPGDILPDASRPDWPA